MADETVQGNAYDQYLTPVYNRLNSGTQFTPLSAQTFGDWSIEAGDIVTVTKDGTDYQTPVMRSGLEWRGASLVTIESTGNKEREALNKLSKKEFANYGAGGSSGGYYGNNGLWKKEGQFIHMLEETASYHRRIMIDEANGLMNYIERTASHSYDELVDTTYSLRNEIESTASYSRQTLSDEINGLVHYIEDTASRSYESLVDTTNSLRNEIENTASQSRQTLIDTGAGQKNEIINTASEHRQTLIDTGTGQKNEIISTASSELQRITNATTGLESRIEQTENKIGLIVEGTGSSAHVNPASIVAAITDENGVLTSSIDISADHVNLTGQIKLNEKLTVMQTGELYAITSIYVAPGSVFNGEHVGSYYYSEQQEGHSVKMPLLKKARVDNGVLKIWTYSDSEANPSITFSKAAGASKVSGSWTDGTYTVAANENGQALPLTMTLSNLVPEGEITVGGTWNKFVYRNARLYMAGPNSTTVDTGFVSRVGINASQVYNNGWDAALDDIVRTTSTASDQDIVIKTLDYDEKWTITDTRHRSNGATDIVKYTVKSKPDRYTDGQGSMGLAKGTWDNGQIQFTKVIGTAQTGGVRVGLTGSWTGNTYNYTIKDYYNDPSGVSTGYTGTIIAPGGEQRTAWLAIGDSGAQWTEGTLSYDQLYSIIYSDGTVPSIIYDGTTHYAVWKAPPDRYDDGAKNAEVAFDRWITTDSRYIGLSNVIRFKNNTSGSSQTDTRAVYLTQDASFNASTNKKFVYMADNAADGPAVGKMEVDASAVRIAGRNDVAINKGSWSSGNIQFTKSVGTASNQSVNLDAADPSWSGNVATVAIYDGDPGGSGVSTGYSVTVNATGRYIEGYNNGSFNASWLVPVSSAGTANEVMTYGKYYALTHNRMDANGNITTETSMAYTWQVPEDRYEQGKADGRSEVTPESHSHWGYAVKYSNNQIDIEGDKYYLWAVSSNRTPNTTVHLYA